MASGLEREWGEGEVRKERGVKGEERRRIWRGKGRRNRKGGEWEGLRREWRGKNDRREEGRGMGSREGKRV